MGLDRLVSFLLEDVLGLLKFWTIVAAFESGVILRFGKYRKTISPGWHFLMPFRIDQALTMNVVFDTLDVGQQSVTTKDGKSVVLNAYISFVVFDAKKAMLDADGVESVISDISAGFIEELAEATTWAAMRKPEFRLTVKKHIQTQARKYGIGVKNVQFSDRSRARSFRLWME